MATENKKILHIESDISAIDDKQLAYEPTNDADLGFQMWGGKDGGSNVTKWLAKDKNARVLNLEATGNLTVGGNATITGTITADNFNFFNLYAETNTTALGTDSSILALTLGGSDYPEMNVDTRKSWKVCLTAQSIGSSNVGVFKRWEGNISFITGNDGGGVAFNKLTFGSLLPVTGSSVDSTVTLTDPVFAYSGSVEPYEIQITVEHENVTTIKTVDIEWTMEIQELSGVAKGWS